MLNMTFLTVLIILSHIPPICKAASGLKYQVIHSIDEYLLIPCILMFNLLAVPFQMMPVAVYISRFPSSIDKSLEAANQTISVITFNYFQVNGSCGRTAEESSPTLISCWLLFYCDWSE